MKEIFEIQQRLNIPKKKYNKFGKFYYRSCEDILDAVKPILHDLECTLFMWDEIHNIGGFNYVKAHAMLTNSEGKEITMSAYAKEADSLSGMSAGQVTGASSSYARKYCLSGLFAISDGQDEDSDNTLQDAVLQRINLAKTVSEITQIYKQERDSYPNQNVLVEACSKRKSQIEEL